MGLRIQSETVATTTTALSGSGTAASTGYTFVQVLNDQSALIASVTSIVLCIITVWGFLQGLRIKKERLAMDKELHIKKMAETNYRLDEGRIVEKTIEAMKKMREEECSICDKK